VGIWLGTGSQDNLVVDNTFTDISSAAIFVMFAAGTTIRNNTIRHTPWTGIAIGWGWGLLDEGSFPGMPYARYFDWGVYTTPTVVRDNRIVSNRAIQTEADVPSRIIDQAGRQ